MPSVREMVHSARFFFDSVLPQASSATQWTVDKAEKSFRWARYCQDLHDSVISSGLCQELDSALSFESKSSNRPALFNHCNLKKAPILLLEEFLRNFQLSDETMLAVLRGMSCVFTQEEFNSICQQAAERRNLHKEVVELIQKMGDDETLASMKAQLIREDLMTDLSPFIIQSKLEPLTRTASSMQLLLMALNFPSDKRLVETVTSHLELYLEEWRRSCVLSLLGCPVELVRTACCHSSRLHLLWLQCLDRLAANLSPIYFNDGRPHVWQWPQDDHLITDQTCHGLWFSFDQLTRHLRNLLTSTEPDRVVVDTRQFILDQCTSIWLEIQQQLL